MARDEYRGLGSDAGLVGVADPQAARILRFLLRPIPDRPVDSLSCLTQSRRALDEEPSDALPALVLQPAKEEPLDDLAQSILGFLSREKGGAGRRSGLQGGSGA